MIARRDLNVPKGQWEHLLPWAMALVALAALTYLIANRLPGPTWDEHFNGRYLRSLNWKSFGPDFLRQQNVSVGPGYFLFLRIFTDGRSIPIEVCRWFSLGFLLATVLVLNHWVTSEKPHTRVGGWLFLGIPLLPMMAGFAMSDLMALFLFLSSLLLLKLGLRAPAKALTAGGLLGLATLTRQVYLLGAVLPAWLVLRERRLTLPLALFLAAAALVPLPLFYSWKGVIPPFLSTWQRGAFSLPYLALSFGEAGLLALLYCPNFFESLRSRGRYLLLPTCVALASMTTWLPMARKYVPLGWAIRLVFPSSFIGVSHLAWGLTLFVGMGLLVFILESIWDETDEWKRGLLLLALALLLVPAFHTVIYSVRYIVAPTVLILLHGHGAIERARFLGVRWSMGVMAGLAVLAWQTRAL